jgi:hypothetical protein
MSTEARSQHRCWVRSAVGNGKDQSQDRDNATHISYSRTRPSDKVDQLSRAAQRSLGGLLSYHSDLEQTASPQRRSKCCSPGPRGVRKRHTELHESALKVEHATRHLWG